MTIGLPSRRAQEIAEAVAAVFRPIVAAWAIDVMQLRKRRLDVPGPRRGRGVAPLAVKGVPGGGIGLYSESSARRLLVNLPLPGRARRAA